MRFASFDPKYGKKMRRFGLVNAGEILYLPATNLMCVNTSLFVIFGRMLSRMGANIVVSIEDRIKRFAQTQRRR